MTTEQLLNPRYEVLINYPRSPFKIGDILKKVIGASTEIYYTEPFPPVGNLLTLFEIKNCPEIFKKLEWWEKRTEEEMPKKVKSYSFPDETYIIEKWDLKIMVGFTNLEKRECCDLTIWQPQAGYYPVD